jgi:hypothetical protein
VPDIRFVELTESLLLRPECSAVIGVGVEAGLRETCQSVPEIGNPVELAVFAVVDDVDTDFDLSLHYLVHTLANDGIELRAIYGFAQRFLDLQFND